MSRDEEYERQERLQRWLNEPIPADDDEWCGISGPLPCRAPSPCTVQVKPGNGPAAYKAGCEDAYQNEMDAKYGEGW